MPTGTPLLEARGIGRLHREGTSWLLRDISLAIGAGDRVALTGPTGSGKTVLLRALAVLDAVNEGTLHWRGKPPTADEVPIYRSQVIYLTQRARLFDGTVEQNLRVPYSLSVHRHLKYSPKNIAAYLDQLGRDETFLNRDAANLSGGEMQIVALLRAIQLDPTVLLLDEPTASLDESAVRQIEQLVADWISATGTSRAFVWVTHDTPQAERVANRVLQLRDGQLVESGADR
ncbi:MAG: ATP-binding cassette domain-containing protein [Planctomycetota bacterium]